MDMGVSLVIDAPKDCVRCPRLCASRKQVVNSAGPVPARVMVVAQNPGRNEEDEGVPLSPNGWSGNRFAWLIEHHTDWNWCDIRRANIVRCRVCDGTRWTQRSSCIRRLPLRGASVPATG